MAETAKKANVKIVAGDTKVVERGSLDKIIINVTLGDHGISIINKRNNLEFDVNVSSDCCLLNNLICDILNVSKKVKVLRDPTRGALATTLNEIAIQSSISMELDEEQIPIKKEVRATWDIIGLDPLYIANEGKVIVIVSEEDAEKVLNIMKHNEEGKVNILPSFYFK